VSYSVELHRDAERYLGQLDRRRQEQVALRLDKLATNPFDPDSSKALHGSLAHLRSARVGDLRLVFEVVQQRLLVHVIRIGPRGDVYKR
jgi:mRNA interferase RelE/StbE